MHGVWPLHFGMSGKSDGKKLSPRKIMMDTRDRMEEVGKNLEKGGSGLTDGKNIAWRLYY